MYAQSLSCVRLFATPQTVACRCPLSRQEYWSGLPFCPPGDHPDPKIKHVSAASLVLAGGFFFFKPLSYLGIGSGITIMNEHINCLHQLIPP